MPKRRQQWEVGDYFRIPLSNGGFAVGQVLSIEPGALNSLVAAISPKLVDEGAAEPPILNSDDWISVTFVTRDLLDRHVWKVFASGPPLDPAAFLPIEKLRREGYVGAKIVGSGIIVDMLEAWYKLRAWDDYFEPDYLDTLLLSTSLRPKDVILTKRG